MRIAIGCDHRGVDFKKDIIQLLLEREYTYEDFGSFNEDPVDYPDIAAKVARAIAGGYCKRGFLICGTGIGMCIAANKVKGIRAAQCYNAFMAKRARLHNDAQICCLAAEGDRDFVPEIIDAFLTTDFEGGRHQLRLDKIKKLEKG